MLNGKLRMSKQGSRVMQPREPCLLIAKRLAFYGVKTNTAKIRKSSNYRKVMKSLTSLRRDVELRLSLDNYMVLEKHHFNA